MEGLGGFDDDLFEESRDRDQRKAPISYNAKFLQPKVRQKQWFLLI